LKNHVTLLSRGISISGAAAGAAIGALGGPMGTVLGAATGGAIVEMSKVLLDDFANRFLSQKEERRIAGVAALAIDQIQGRLLWETRRSDDFFDGTPDRPSPAEEIFEGVLLSAKQEHEDLKLPYLANFYSNLPFRPDVLRSEANYVLAVAETLTYEQFKILGLMSQAARFPIRRDQWPDPKSISPHSSVLAQQLLHLYERHLILSYEDDGEISSGIYDIDLIVPSFLSLSASGKRFVDLLGLRTIPEDELKRLAENL